MVYQLCLNHVRPPRDPRSASMPNTTTTTEKNSTGGATARPDGGREVSVHSSDHALASDFGRTQIADVVVQKIAGLAAREIAGVRQLGGGAARAFGALRERIPGAGTSHGQGVTVEVGERQAAVDLEIFVEYGVVIPDLARAVRKNVITAIERMTGLEVVEVNINVNDVSLGDEDEDGEPVQGGSRVE
jgi:uncharacterized alkaline shock family protein YloU